MPLPAMTASRYQRRRRVALRALSCACGLTKLLRSFQLFESSVTASARTGRRDVRVAEAGAVRVPVALDVDRVLRRDRQARARRGCRARRWSASARGGRRSAGCAARSSIVVRVAGRSRRPRPRGRGERRRHVGRAAGASADAVGGARRLRRRSRAWPLPLKSSPVSSAPFGVPVADAGLTMSSKPYSPVSGAGGVAVAAAIGEVDREAVDVERVAPVHAIGQLPPESCPGTSATGCARRARRSA